MKTENKPLLTIGILTLPQRKEMIERLQNHFKRNTPDQFLNMVEFIINEDDGTKTVGKKRNEVLDQAKGQYVCFVDDDDLVEPDYIESICNILTDNDCDGVSFWGMYYVSGHPIMVFNHANANGGHFKKDGRQYRPLNHLNPVRTEIAREIRFLEKNFGEDADYCDRLLESGKIKKECDIDRVMYHYLWDPKTTETQK